VKFTFPNRYGIYLHDTPDKTITNRGNPAVQRRLHSPRGRGPPRRSGCSAATLKATSKEPEIEVPLDRPVPVYVTYLTAVPSGSTITYFNDVYGWDAQRLAEIGSSSRVAAR
jgi:L,D-transpeptidase YcbB